MKLFYFLAKIYDMPVLLHIYFIWVIGFYISTCEKYDREIGTE